MIILLLFFLRALQLLHLAVRLLDDYFDQCMLSLSMHLFCAVYLLAWTGTLYYNHSFLVLIVLYFQSWHCNYRIFSHIYNKGQLYLHLQQRNSSDSKHKSNVTTTWVPQSFYAPRSSRSEVRSKRKFEERIYNPSVYIFNCAYIAHSWRLK